VIRRAIQLRTCHKIDLPAAEGGEQRNWPWSGRWSPRLSHEIKNPLASILVGLKTLQRDSPGSPEHGIIFDLVFEEMDSLTTTINRLLESARPPASSTGPVYVEHLLNKCMASCGLLATRRGIGLELVPFPASSVVIVDEQDMSRVLNNLVQNALDASSKGDRIRIGWRELDQAGKDELVPGFSGKVVDIFVEDEGTGLPEEVSPGSIFGPFVTTKVLGSGLGLTVSQEIVDAQGGVITVDSRPNQGTKFEILLPSPEPIPCWDRHGDRAFECRSPNVNCKACEVKTAGTGYCCWKVKGRAYHAETGLWPDTCLKCGFFRASSLIPFFEFRPVSSKRG